MRAFVAKARAAGADAQGEVVAGDHMGVVRAVLADEAVFARIVLIGATR